MTFKNNWEKSETRISIDEKAIYSMVKQAFFNTTLLSYKLISGGCANLNFKLIFKDQDKPLVLRIYIRDKISAYKEQKLSLLIKQKVPIPESYYIGKFDGFVFAITEFMQGILLRDLLLYRPEENSNKVLYEAGNTISAISSFKFDLAGSFNKDLNIIMPNESGNCLEYAITCLRHKTVKEQLGSNQISLINKCLEKFGHLFPSNFNKFLVHGDFDPANILVDKIDGSWKIAAILDWEFAFSGSWLWDVSNMLRYAHQMPPEFEISFLKGITDNGLILPDYWRTTVYLLNISSLLDLMMRCSGVDQPNQCNDITKLIGYFTDQLLSKGLT